MTTIASGRPATKPADEGAPATHQFSCNSCQVAFRNVDLQKSHMKGEWHRYNLKRRVINLPPISSDLFAEKTLQNRAGAAAEAGRVGFERNCDVCQKTYFSENSYQNHIGSQKHKAKAAKAGPKRAKSSKAPIDDASTVISSTFSLGEPTQKVQPTVVDTETETVGSEAEEEFSQVVEGLKKATMEEGHSPVKRPANPRLSAAAQHKGEHPLDSEEADEEETEESNTPTAKQSEPAHSLKLCLFCNYASPTIALSVAHMSRFHNMFIPEKQYLVDLEGLLSHLETRIRDDHACITCGKVRGDVFAVQTHMRDKAHCSIPYLTLEEQVDIGDFYDFRGTYSDSDPEDDDDDDDSDEEGEKKKAGASKLGAKRATKTTTADGSDITGGEEEDGWETDSSASSLDSADLTAVPADNHIHQYERLDKHPHHSQTDPRAHHQPDGWHSHAHKHNHAVYYDEHELHLPSGRSVGHRSLNRYFRQNLHNYPSLAEREKQMQLAIEAGVEFDSEDEDEDGEGVEGEAASLALARRSNAAKARAVSTRPAPRNTMGLTGVTDKAKANLLKVERRHELAQQIAADKGRIKFSANSIGQSFRFLGRT
ncbi:pre-60S factor rei1 [Sporothrix stenoceras]|uniref:Pre-60S factor rei1 n=1 Tax=Sporothrix stenoceras TaxID=5173 RepID=A0ABR3ZFN1_9PEZI